MEVTCRGRDVRTDTVPPTRLLLCENSHTSTVPPTPLLLCAMTSERRRSDGIEKGGQTFARALHDLETLHFALLFHHVTTLNPKPPNPKP